MNIRFRCKHLKLLFLKTIYRVLKKFQFFHQFHFLFALGTFILHFFALLHEILYLFQFIYLWKNLIYQVQISSIYFYIALSEGSSPPQELNLGTNTLSGHVSSTLRTTFIFILFILCHDLWKYFLIINFNITKNHSLDSQINIIKDFFDWMLELRYQITQTKRGNMFVPLWKCLYWNAENWFYYYSFWEFNSKMQKIYTIFEWFIVIFRYIAAIKIPLGL